MNLLAPQGKILDPNYPQTPPTCLSFPTLNKMKDDVKWVKKNKDSNLGSYREQNFINNFQIQQTLYLVNIQQRLNALTIIIEVVEKEDYIPEKNHASINIVTQLHNASIGRILDSQRNILLWILVSQVGASGKPHFMSIPFIFMGFFIFSNVEKSIKCLQVCEVVQFLQGFKRMLRMLQHIRNYLVDALNSSVLRIRAYCNIIDKLSIPQFL